MGEPMTIDEARQVATALSALTEGDSWRAEPLRSIADALATALAEVERLADFADAAVREYHAAKAQEAAAIRFAQQADTSLADANRGAARLSAEVERLTLERDALAVEVSTLPYPSDLAEVTSDRDRLAAALAEVREAADALVECVDAIDGDALRYGLGPALDAADTVRNLASIPADLAAAHDARVRAEAFEDVACAFDCLAMMARKPGLVSRYTEAAARVRAEAERIGGGR